MKNFHLYDVMWPMQSQNITVKIKDITIKKLHKKEDVLWKISIMYWSKCSFF